MRRTLKELRTSSAEIASATATLHVTVSRATTDVVGRDAGARVADMLGHDGVRFAAEDTKRGMKVRLVNTLTKDRRDTAGVALHQLQAGLPSFTQDVADSLAAARLDVSLTWPDAFNRMDNVGMVNAGIYRELRQKRIDEMGPAELIHTYERALEERHLATSRIDAELIEARLDRRGGIAKAERDVPIVKRLGGTIEAVRDSRIDPELESLQEVIEAAKKTITRARLINIVPVDLSIALPDVREVVERELEEAGAAV